jgi:hypothetical protein
MAVRRADRLGWAARDIARRFVNPGSLRHLAHWRSARSTPPGERRRGYDLETTAFLHGISLFELERRLKVRRRQTARIAYATLALGCIFLTAWIWEALLSPWTAMRVVLALEFLPFCALFFLLAFYNALLNFQIRIGRAASWREYLATDEPFWPR